MDWTIYSYHNVEALRGVLNAIAMLTGSGDFKSSLGVVLLFGFFAAIIAYAFAPQKMHGWHWLASVVLVYLVLFVPKARVQLMDVTADEPPAVVANVPLGLAILAGASSQVGHVLTQAFETVFSAIPGTGPGSRPEALSYQRNGMMFGARLIATSQNLSFQSATFRADLMEFFSNCVEPELDTEKLPADEFAHSKNIWKLLDGRTNPARFSTVSGADAALKTCPEVYTSLNGRMGGEVTQLLRRLANILHPTLGVDDAAARVEDEITAAFATSMLVDASQTAGDVVAQNAVINAIKDGSALAFVRSGDTTGLLMNQATSSTYHQKNSAFISNAKIAEQALPVVRNVIEAVTYALFPLMVLLLFLTSGRETMVAFRNYASILIWIQLWPPLYAILNFMAGIYASYDMAAAGMIDPMSAARGVALATSGAINDNALSCQAVVGYLTFSIPFLAWSALKRMENFGSTAAGMLSGLQQTGDSNAASASVGNMSWGMMSRNQANVSPFRSHPGASRVEGPDGTVTQTTASGEKFLTQPQSNMWLKDTYRFNKGAEAAVQIGRKLQESESKRKGMVDDVSQTFADALRWKMDRGNTDGVREGTGTDRTGSGSDDYARLWGLMKSWAHDINIGDTDQATIAAGISLLFGGKTRVGDKGLTGMVGRLINMIPNLQGQFSSNRQLADLVKKADQAFDKYDASGTRTLRQQYLESAGKELATKTTEGTSVDKGSTFADKLSRYASNEASIAESLEQMRSARESESANETQTVDLVSFDAYTQQLYAAVPRGDVQGALRAQELARNHVKEKLDWVALISNMSHNPHPLPIEVADGKGGVLTPNTDLHRTYHDATQETPQLTPKEKAAVLYRKASDDARVLANLNKADPNAPDVTHTAKPKGSVDHGDAGPASVWHQGDEFGPPGYRAWSWAGQPTANMLPGNKGMVGPVQDLSHFDNVMQRINDAKANLKGQFGARGATVNGYPGATSDENGNVTSVHTPFADGFNTTWGVVKGGINHVVGRYDAAVNQERADNYMKKMPGASRAQADAHVRELSSAAANGSMQAKLELHALSGSSDLLDGRALTWNQAQDTLRAELGARGESMNQLPANRDEGVLTKIWNYTGAPIWTTIRGPYSTKAEPAVAAPAAASKAPTSAPGATAHAAKSPAAPTSPKGEGKP